MKFNKAIKIYLHKGKEIIDISIKVSNNFDVGYNMPKVEFEYLLRCWNMKGGTNIDNNGEDWFIQHKRASPQPESAPDSYVRISVSRNGQKNHHRVSYDDMVALEREYFYQKHNIMHWDSDV